MKLIITLFLVFSFQTHAKDIELVKDSFYNPGNLSAYEYVPAYISENTPLIVLLHGCTQTAQEFATNNGWISKAKENGYLLLMLEQKKINNDLKCFNWFKLQDQFKGIGEAGSVGNLVKVFQQKHNISANNTFITGFSAGAGMATNMISLYPELFKAAAISAGLPYGCANNLAAATLCMHGLVKKASIAWRLKVRMANPTYINAYPNVLVLQGTDDPTVHQSNAVELVKQWTSVHNLDLKRGLTKKRPIYTSTSYLEVDEVRVEHLSINNLGHKIPIDPKNDCGVLGRWEEDFNFCSTSYILKFWKLQYK